MDKQRVPLRMLDTLRQQVRQVDGRDAEPSAGIIDSQSVKGAEPVSRTTRGDDAGKKVNGCKRFIITDTLGLLLTVTVCAASVQDRDGAKGDVLHTTVSIVRKPADQKGFAVLPRRWAVERTLAWLTAHRRLARDYE